MPIGWLAVGCPNTHAPSASDLIKTKSIFAELVGLARIVFDSSLIFGYQAGLNANPM